MQILSQAAVNRQPLMKAGARKLYDADEIQPRYGTWLRIPEPFDKYMVFLSYRWMTFDSHCVSLIYDIFSNFLIGKDHTAVNVFLDKRLFQSGEHFQFIFVKALTQSCVLMPIVSADSLKKMISDDGSQFDNILLEWVVGLELVKS